MNVPKECTLCWRGKRTQGQKLIESLHLKSNDEPIHIKVNWKLKEESVNQTIKKNFVVIASKIYRPIFKEIDPYPSLNMQKVPWNCFNSPFGKITPDVKKANIFFCYYCNIYFKESDLHRMSTIHQNKIKDPKLFQEFDILAKILNKELFTNVNQQTLKITLLHSY